MKQSIVINSKPEGNLPDVIKDMFSSSTAISKAVSKFWDMGLAAKAELGKVSRLEDGSYNVEIIY